MTDEELDERLNHTHQTGISEGLRRAAEHIMEAAKNAFERFGGADRTAARLRHLANELHVMANTAHPGTPNAALRRGEPVASNGVVGGKVDP